MTHLGTIEGRGRIIVDGQELGEGQYVITVSRPRLVMEAYGSLVADGGILARAFQSDKHATLILESGETVAFIVTQSDFMSDEAEIKISGPVPGFK